MAQDLSAFKKPENRKTLKTAEAEKEKTENQKPKGRPVKDDDEKLSVKISLNFTRSEKQKLDAAAKEQGIPLTALIRMVLKREGVI